MRFPPGCPPIMPPRPPRRLLPSATQGLMLMPLLRHQRAALAWMVGREGDKRGGGPCGGILADDQVGGLAGAPAGTAVLQGWL